MLRKKSGNYSIYNVHGYRSEASPTESSPVNMGWWDIIRVNHARQPVRLTAGNGGKKLMAESEDKLCEASPTVSSSHAYILVFTDRESNRFLKK